MRTRREAFADFGLGAIALASGASAFGATSAKAMTLEPPLDPDLPIIDAHHHLGPDYSGEDFVSDIRASGHNVLATVYVDCLVYYRDSGPEAMRPVGEVEFANGVAAKAASGAYGPIRACAGIVGHADLRSDMAGAVLDAEMASAGQRFKGIRQMGAWDRDPTILGELAPKLNVFEHFYSDSRFREGFRLLEPRGLSFDAWVLEPQMDDVLQLARAFPGTLIILNHVGGPLGIGSYRGRLSERFPGWRAKIHQIAECSNVVVKLGGLGEAYQGLRGPGGGVRLGSEDLARNWRPYLETAIEAFGTKRAMFESDFQVEKEAMDYGTIWNAFKRVTAGASADERQDLFSGSAQRIYRLGHSAGGTGI